MPQDRKRSVQITVGGLVFDLEWPPHTWNTAHAKKMCLLPKPPGKWYPYQGVYVIASSSLEVFRNIDDVTRKVSGIERCLVTAYTNLYRAPVGFKFITVGNYDGMVGYKLIRRIVLNRGGINIGI